MNGIFFLPGITFDREEIKQCPNVFFFGGNDSVVYGIIIELFARNQQRLVQNMAEDILLQFGKALE